MYLVDSADFKENKITFLLVSTVERFMKLVDWCVNEEINYDMSP